MKKYLGLVLTVLVIFFSACGGSPKPEVISYPSWYLNPPANNGSFLYGVGEGSNINIAKAAALSFVSESLSLTVSSKLRKSESSSSYNGNENTYRSTVSSLKAQAKDMEFSEYKIVKNEQIGSRIVLLVEVSRHKLFADQKAKLDLYTKELKAEVKDIQKYPLLKQAQLYKERAKKRYILKSMALLTKTINSKFKTDAYITQAIQVGAASTDALNKVKIFVHSSSKSKVFVSSIKEGLNKAGIKIASKGANTNLYIDVNYNLDEIYSFQIAKARLSFTTKSKAKTIATNTVTVSGKSKYGYDKAKVNASNMLKKKIKKDGIFSVLGLK